MDLIEQGYIIVSGFIDAKDDRGRTVYGSVLAFVSRRDIKFISVFFSRDEVDKELDWAELLSVHKSAREDEERDPLLVRNEEDIMSYLSNGNTLNRIIRNQSAKQAEQAISRYCNDRLQMKAVSFIDFAEASDSDIRYLDAVMNDSAEEKGGQDAKSSEPLDEKTEIYEAEGEDRSPADIFIRCNPILDPVNGKAVSELKIGDHVYGNLPEDSVFHKLMTKNFGSFDGTLTAAVTGILINDLGTATVSLELSDGVAGVMKLSGKVKIKVASEGTVPHKKKASSEKKFDFADISTEVIFTLAGSIILISALGIIYYVFK